MNPFKYDYDRKFHFRINGDIWECYLITEEEAAELDLKFHDIEDGFSGITDTTDKCIFIAEDNVTRSVIIHELFHVYVHYFHLSAAHVTVAQFEEIVADFLGERLMLFAESAERLFAKFKRLDGSK